MGFKRLVNRRRTVAAAAIAEIAPADPFGAEPTASTEQEADDVSAATAEGEPSGQVSPVADAAEENKPNAVDSEPEVKDRKGDATADCKMEEDAMVGETEMEAEESDEEDPVEAELVADEANAADGKCRASCLVLDKRLCALLSLQKHRSFGWGYQLTRNAPLQDKRSQKLQ